jgi:hypothetical protein
VRELVWFIIRPHFAMPTVAKKANLNTSHTESALPAGELAAHFLNEMIKSDQPRDLSQKIGPS